MNKSFARKSALAHRALLVNWRVIVGGQDEIVYGVCGVRNRMLFAAMLRLIMPMEGGLSRTVTSALSARDACVRLSETKRT